MAVKETKCIAEWRMYLNITKKKIEKARKDLFENYNTVYFVTTEKNYADNKVKYEEKEKEAKAIYSSLVALESNYEKVQKAVQLYNAKNTITVCGEEMSIATAIDRYKNKEAESAKLYKYAQIAAKKEQEELSTLRKYETERERLLDMLVTGSRVATNNEKEAVENRCKEFFPKSEWFIDVKKLYEEKYNQHITFLEEVNIKINIANSTTQVEIELD